MKTDDGRELDTERFARWLLTGLDEPPPELLGGQLDLLSQSPEASNERPQLVTGADETPRENRDIPEPESNGNL